MSVYSPGDETKIRGVIASAVDIYREIATLKEGLKENIESVADEVDIDKKALQFAIRMAVKSSQKNQNAVDDMQAMLDSAVELLKVAGNV